MSDQEITLYAGADAFGDGSHPTTQMMLAALDAIDTQTFTPSAVCDMGCGAGLLAICAAQKFTCPVIAVDIEKSAVEATRENALRNNIPSPLQGEGYVIPLQADGFNHPTITAHAPYDLILMNLLEKPLIALAYAAHKHLAAEGVLIMSGILSWQEAGIIETYKALGLGLLHRLQQGDWVALLWIRGA